MKRVGWPEGHIPPVSSRCDGCGNTDGRIAAHNEDYSRPHTFWSLCSPCHRIVHLRFRDGPGFVEYRRRVMHGWPMSVLQHLRLTPIEVDRADFPPLNPEPSLF